MTLPVFDAAGTFGLTFSNATHNTTALAVVTASANDTIVVIASAENNTVSTTCFVAAVANTGTAVLSWTKLTGVSWNAGSGGQQSCLECWTAKAVSAGTYNVTVTFNSTIDAACLTGVGIVGGDSTTPIDVGATTVWSDSIASNNTTSPLITSTHMNLLALLAWTAGGQATGGPSGAPSGWTALTSQSSSGPNQSNSLYIYDQSTTSGLNHYTVTINSTQSIKHAGIVLAITSDATGNIYPVTLTQNLTGSSTLTVGAGHSVALQQTINLSSSSAIAMHFHPVLLQRLLMSSASVLAHNLVLTLTQGFTVSLATVQKFTWRRLLTQALRVHDVVSLGGVRYALSLVQTLTLVGAPIVGFSVTLNQHINVHPSQFNTLGLRLLQKLLLAAAQVPLLRYHVALAGQLVFREKLTRSIGAVLAQLFNIHQTSTQQFTTSAVLVQLLTMRPTFTNKLVLQITGNLIVTPAQLMKMIYKGDSLLDGMIINALYISPSGTTTTWAVNTRTNAVTEYRNYSFNSFAVLNNRYIAANSSGLYELDGATDNGAAIVAEMMSGFFQLNEKKLFGIKGVYVAMRGSGRFYLKLISGDGREYIYELRLQPNLMTTKVKVGKGIRTAYMAFDLLTEGQDFDFDSIEFVPMVSGRRV